MSNLRIDLLETVQAALCRLLFHILRFLQELVIIHPVYAISLCSSPDSGPSCDKILRILFIDDSIEIISVS